MLKWVLVVPAILSLVLILLSDADATFNGSEVGGFTLFLIITFAIGAFISYTSDVINLIQILLGYSKND